MKKKLSANSTDSIQQFEHASFENLETYATSLYSQIKQSKKTSKRKIIFLALIVLALAMALAFITYQTFVIEDESQGSHLQIKPEKTQEDIQQQINEETAASVMNVTITPRLFVDENLRGDIGIENILENHVDQKVTLKTIDGDTLYKSGFISPGETLETITLSQLPPQNDDRIIAVFTGHDRTTHEKIGAMSVEIKFYQKGKEQ